MSFHRALSWVSVTKCAAGKHFVAAKSGNPAKCEACVSGTFNANDDSSADCAKHKTCEAGEWTKAAGNATTDTSCSKCSKGRFRAKAPTDNKLENETNVCGAHKICKAGEWRKAVGNATTDTLCVAHKICEAGEWTKAAGNATTDTSCSKCSKGRFRAKAPTDNKAENETSVCRKRMSCTFKSIGACTAHKYAVAQTNFCCCRVYVLSCTRFYAQSTSTYCMREKCTQG